jgi:hypothetical protein
MTMATKEKKKKKCIAFRLVVVVQNGTNSLQSARHGSDIGSGGGGGGREAPLSSIVSSTDVKVVGEATEEAANA